MVRVSKAVLARIQRDLGENVEFSPKRGKYNARRIEIDGIKFESEAESRRYGDLKILERIGQISRLEVHPSWDLIVNDVYIGRFTADFRYLNENGETIIEDVKPEKKSIWSRDYILRKKLLFALYGLKVIEVH